MELNTWRYGRCARARRLRAGALLLLCLTVVVSPGAAQEGQLLDGIAAIVNDEIITISEVREAIALETNRLREQYGDSALQEQPADLYRLVLQGLIDVRIQLARARKMNLQVSDEDVTYHIETMQKQNQISADQLLDALRQRGLTLEGYRQQVKEGLLVAKVVNAEVRSRLVVMDTELREEYQRRRDRYTTPGELTVSHILFLLSDEASADEEARARQQAAEVMRKLQAGEDFAALARQYSEGPSAERSGLLGTFRTGELLPGFEEAVATLKPGEISEVVRTRAGLHIIRLEARQTGGYRAFEDVEQEIKAELLGVKTEHRYKEWLETLRQSAYVKILYEG